LSIFWNFLNSEVDLLFWNFSSSFLELFFTAGSVVPGAGAFEFALHEELTRFVTEGNIKGKSSFGVEAFAKAFLIIPKTLAQNAGYDTQDVMVKLHQEYRNSKKVVGVDCDTGTSSTLPLVFSRKFNGNFFFRFFFRQRHVSGRSWHLGQLSSEETANQHMVSPGNNFSVLN
jgi:hypothetical protein